MNGFNSTVARLELDRLAARAQRSLLRWKLSDELREAVARSALWLFVGPLLILGSMTAGWSALMPNPVMLVVAALLGPVLYVLGRMLLVLVRYRPRRHEGLALFDTQLDTREKLVTADEFLSE